MIFIFSIIIVFLLFLLLICHTKIKCLLDIVLKYEKIIDDQGKKNHEYNNQLLVLLGCIDNKKKLKDYLYTIIDDHKTGQNYEIRQLSHMPEGGIKKLLYFKMYKMNKNNVNCCLYISEDAGKIVENLNLRMYKDLTKILGVFIDNSFEAAKNSKERDVFIDFKEDGNYLNITISNSYNNELIDKVGKNKFSTKGEGHGYGLLLVKEINKRNKKIEIVTDYDKDMFKQTVLVDLS